MFGFTCGIKPCCQAEVARRLASDRQSTRPPKNGAGGDNGARAFGLPETIQHDDLHDGQVFVRDGRYRILDWGDACVSHPFFTLSVTLEGVLAWGIDDVQGSVEIDPFRDAYLAPFARVDTRGDLDSACTTAMRLGWVCRAINCHLGGSESAETHVQLRMFLDGRP